MGELTDGRFIIIRFAHPPLLPGRVLSQEGYTANATTASAFIVP